MNPIQVLTQSRIRQLLEQSNSVSVIKHNATIGQLRESFLIDFLKDMIPKKYEINTGVICDASGKISRQLDIIITDESYLPKINFEGRNSIVPIESALMFAEVKSTLVKSDFEQIEQQIKGVNKLRYSQDKRFGKSENLGVYGLVLAFDCNINEETLRKWIEKTNTIIAVCIIDKFSILKLGPNETKIIKSDEEEIEFFETLVFIGKLFQALKSQSIARDFVPSWEMYMQGLNTNNNRQ